MLSAGIWNRPSVILLIVAAEADKTKTHPQPSPLCLHQPVSLSLTFRLHALDGANPEIAIALRSWKLQRTRSGLFHQSSRSTRYQLGGNAGIGRAAAIEFAKQG